MDECIRQFALDHSVFYRPSIDGQRCAICLNELVVGVDSLEDQLRHIGLCLVTVDLVTLARSRCGYSTYQLHTTASDAPETVDCSLFTWWLYQSLGVSIPRYALTQRQEAVHVPVTTSADFGNIQPGDLLFTKGHHGYFLNDPADAVGHVGLATGEGTIIHAANSRRGVVEDTVEMFVEGWETFRGVGRIIPSGSEIATVQVTQKGLTLFSARDVQRSLLRFMRRDS